MPKMQLSGNDAERGHGTPHFEGAFPTFTESRTNAMRQRRKKQGGFSFVEVALALIVFTLMALMFGAVFPMTVRGAQFSKSYAQASLLAQHKLDQMRSETYNGIDPGDYAQLQADSVIDAGGAAPTSLPYAVSFTNVDALSVGPDASTPGFFPPGTVGWIVVSDYGSSAPVTMPDGTQSTPTNDAGDNFGTGEARLITVIIKWPGVSGTAGQYTATCLVTNHS